MIEEEDIINEDRFGRLAAELLAALADGRIDKAERDRIFDVLAEVVRVDALVNKGVDFIVDLLHRDQDELRAAAERKRERAAKVQVLIDDVRAGKAIMSSRRLRRLTSKVADLYDDAEELDYRANALDAAEEAEE